MLNNDSMQHDSMFQLGFCCLRSLVSAMSSNTALNVEGQVEFLRFLHAVQFFGGAFHHVSSP
jgi:hypothetical protein